MELTSLGVFLLPSVFPWLNILLWSRFYPTCSVNEVWNRRTSRVQVFASSEASQESPARAAGPQTASPEAHVRALPNPLGPQQWVAGNQGQKTLLENDPLWRPHFIDNVRV